MKWNVRRLHDRLYHTTRPRQCHPFVGATVGPSKRLPPCCSRVRLVLGLGNAEAPPERSQCPVARDPLAPPNTSAPRGQCAPGQYPDARKGTARLFGASSCAPAPRQARPWTPPRAPSSTDHVARSCCAKRASATGRSPSARPQASSIPCGAQAGGHEPISHTRLSAAPVGQPLTGAPARPALMSRRNGNEGGTPPRMPRGRCIPLGTCWFGAQGRVEDENKSRPRASLPSQRCTRRLEACSPCKERQTKRVKDEQIWRPWERQIW